MTEELQDLLRLYEALQECAPNNQAAHQDAFKLAVKRVADAHGLFHWHVAAHVVRQWDVKCQIENKRKGHGQDKGGGSGI